MLYLNKELRSSTAPGEKAASSLQLASWRRSRPKAVVHAEPGLRPDEGNGMKVMGHVGFSILITDDDDGHRETLREIIEPQGFHILLATSGEEAVDIAPAHALPPPPLPL